MTEAPTEASMMSRATRRMHSKPTSVTSVAQGSKTSTEVRGAEGGVQKEQLPRKQLVSPTRRRNVHDKQMLLDIQLLVKLARCM